MISRRRSRRRCPFSFKAKAKATIKTVLEFDQPVHFRRNARSVKCVRIEMAPRVAKCRHNKVDLCIVMPSGEANNNLFQKFLRAYSRVNMVSQFKLDSGVSLMRKNAHTLRGTKVFGGPVKLPDYFTNYVDNHLCLALRSDEQHQEDSRSAYNAGLALRSDEQRYYEVKWV